MNPEKKFIITRRSFLMIALLLCVLVAMSPLRAARNWRLALTQDRLYVTNDFAEPISKLHIVFYGMNGSVFPEHQLVFCNVPSTADQWQLFAPDWGNGDSSRFFKIEGFTTSGRRIGSSELYEASMYVPPIIELGLGARFCITVQSDSNLKIRPKP